jgi:Fe-S cluster assembly protein SufD
MRARGIPKPIATNLLTLSFLAQAVEEIEDEGLRDEINDRLTSWLEQELG